MSVVSAGICGADVNLGPLRVGEVFAGGNSRAPYLVARKENGVNAFGGETYAPDADGARQEVRFGGGPLADEYASRP